MTAWWHRGVPASELDGIGIAFRTVTETTTKLSVRMSAVLHKRLKIAAITHDSSVQDLVIEALEKHLSSLDA